MWACLDSNLKHGIYKILLSAPGGGYLLVPCTPGTTPGTPSGHDQVFYWYTLVVLKGSAPYQVPGTVTTELVDYLVVYWHLELRMYNNHVLILVLPHIYIISTGSNYVRLPVPGT